jgi:hypothetical protein
MSFILQQLVYEAHIASTLVERQATNGNFPTDTTLEVTKDIS